ncbi:hypothetical protein AB9M62_20975 [Bacillales bacterium AN1005]
MFDYGLLNIGSVVLGLIALAIPTYCLKNKKHENSIVLSSISYAACAISLCFQIFYNYNLVKREDWSALFRYDWCSGRRFSSTCYRDNIIERNDDSCSY